MSRRLLFLLAGPLVTWVPWTALAAEDGTCSAEDAAEGGCRLADQLAEQLESELDGVAKDIQKMCPLYESRMTPMVLWVLGILKRSTGTMSMLSLWPSGVHPETFADEYTASVMTIIGRVLLGMYKTRDKAYRRGLSALSRRTSEEEVWDASEAGLPNMLKLEVTTASGQSLPQNVLLDLAVVSAHLARISLAAYSKGLYGIVMPARAFFTRACCLLSGHAAFEEMSGISREDILDAEVVAEAFQPVYWILRDRQLKSLVIAVRGTFSMSDIISDVYASQTEHEGHVLHGGILHGARWIYDKVLPHLREGEHVVISGHSLGGAIAAVLAWLLRDVAGFTNAFAVVFGVPQVVDESLAKKMQRYVVGFIHGYDLVPQLSQKSVQDFTEEIKDAAQTPEERLAKLERVLQDFALPSSPERLHRVLLRGRGMVSLRQTESPGGSDFSDAVADVGQLPPIVMQNPGWQIHLRRRSNVRHADKVPILWKRSMKHFIIAVSSAKAHRKIQPAFTMWQDHWPQGYLYVLETFAERLTDAAGVSTDTAQPDLAEALERVRGVLNGQSPAVTV